MSKRRRLDYERLEIYLVQLLLAYRPLLLFCGFILLVCAVAVIVTSVWMGFMMLIFSVFMLLLTSSYPFVVFVARLGAWVALLGRGEE
jgi:hypothetical protein